MHCQGCEADDVALNLYAITHSGTVEAVRYCSVCADCALDVGEIEDIEILGDGPDDAWLTTHPCVGNSAAECIRAAVSLGGADALDALHRARMWATEAWLDGRGSEWDRFAAILDGAVTVVVAADVRPFGGAR